MKSIIFLNYIGKVAFGTVNDANAFGNLIFHMSDMLTPIQSMVSDYTEIF